MKRRIDRLIVHCSATKPNWMAGRGLLAKRDEIDRWHREDNGWSGIGYHYLIDRDGHFTQGRDPERTGAHVKGHNTGSLGICLIGGHGAAATDSFADHFTSAQEKTLVAMLDSWLEDFPQATVHGHNEFASKGCPGFDVQSWWAAQHPPATDYVKQPKVKTDWLSNLIKAIMEWFK